MTDNPSVPLGTVLRAWTKLGCTGFGGPPAHLALLRRLCVDEQGWLDTATFDHAVATTAMLPGPASTQMAIFCAWRVAGPLGGLVGGVAFIVPGLLAIVVAAAVLVTSSPPRWLLGMGAGAGAVVGAIALRTALDLARGLRGRLDGPSAIRWSAAYAMAGLVATVLVGPWLVVVLLACGAAELGRRHPSRGPLSIAGVLPILAATTAIPALALSAFTIGALAFGGGFVIIPLLRADALGHHWLTAAQFLDAVALGQLTPGPVVQTVAVVGYGAAGLAGALLAAVVAFAPSFAFVLLGAPHFERLRHDDRANAFLDGAAPATIGAIGGSAVLLATSITTGWQVGVAVVVGLGGIVLARRSTVSMLLLAAGIGLIVALLTSAGL